MSRSAPALRQPLPARRLVAAACLALAVLALASCSAPSTRGPGPPRNVPPEHDGALITYWADNRPREDGRYRNGRRHGHVRGYHPDGSLAFAGDFEDGVPTGQLVQHYPGGALAVEQRVVDGVLHGERVEHFPGGGVAARIAMHEGQRHGEFVRFHPDGRVALRGRCERDVPVGVWEEFAADGRRVRELHYIADGRPAAEAGVGAANDEPAALQAAPPPAAYLETVFDADGKISIQTWARRAGADWITRITTWTPDGQQTGLFELRNGTREGREQVFDTAGVLRLDGRYRDDRREGRWEVRDAQGQLVSVTEWRDGVEVARPETGPGAP